MTTFCSTTCARCGGSSSKETETSSWTSGGLAGSVTATSAAATAGPSASPGAAQNASAAAHCAAASDWSSGQPPHNFVHDGRPRVDAAKGRVAKDAIERLVHR